MLKNYKNLVKEIFLATFGNFVHYLFSIVMVRTLGKPETRFIMLKSKLFDYLVSWLRAYLGRGMGNLLHKSFSVA